MGNAGKSSLQIMNDNPDIMSALAGSEVPEAKNTMAYYEFLQKQKDKADEAQAGRDARAQMRADAANERTSKNEDRRSDKQFQQENQLRTQFDGMAKTYIDSRDYYKRIKTSVKNESPAGDLAIVYNYMKMLDPGSVVRESEFAAAASTGAYGEKVKAAVERYVNGQRLTDAQKKDFLQSTENLYAEQKNSFNALKSKYSTIAKNYGLDPDRVTSGLLYDEPEEKTKEKSTRDYGKEYGF